MNKEVLKRKQNASITQVTLMFKSLVRKIDLFVRANLAKECYGALFSLGNNKSPGNDVRCDKFYVSFSQ